MFSFGAGVLIGTPSGTNATPVNFGLIQEATIDDTQTLKELFGQNKRAIAVGAGTVKTTLKAKMARISGLALGSLYYGITPTPGQTASAMGEVGTIPAATAYTVTVSNSATWTQDQGVVYAASGLPLTRVASAPAIGQYSVAAGIYTFAVADASTMVLISYNYTIASTGQSIMVNNPLIGQTVSFSANLFTIDPTTNKTATFQLYNAVMSKFSFGTKLEDFVMPEFDASCYVNAAGFLGQWNWPDKF